MKKKVIALLRVSGAAQAARDREGLPVQRDDCLAIAAAHNLDIVEWVELDGVSGAAVLSDLRFQGLLARLREPRISGVVVGAFDRLFRRGRFSDYAILDAFVDARAMLYTPQGVYDLEADSDALLGVIHSELSAAERRNIARRTRAGRERKRREHGVRAEGPVGLPRGVLYSKEAGWRYDWPEAERIREVFALFLGGTTNLAEIARRVGIAHKGQSNSESWAIRSILTQPLYKGVYRVDKRWVGRGRWVPRAPEDCYEHVVLAPPLISPGDWARAQERLSALRGARPRLPAPEERPLDYLGHLICAGCGGPLSSRREKGGL